MNNARQIYAEQVRSLLYNCNAEPFIDGSWTSHKLANDYAEVGEDLGISLDEAVEIIERELERYSDELGFVEPPKKRFTKEELVQIAETRDRLNAAAKEQARKLLGRYKWTPPQRRRLEQQAEKGYILETHGIIAKAFGRTMPNNPDDLATYRIGWLGSKVSAKKRLNFTC